jgi:hypothetical protein
VTSLGASLFGVLAATLGDAGAAGWVDVFRCCQRVSPATCLLRPAFSTELKRPGRRSLALASFPGAWTQCSLYCRACVVQSSSAPDLVQLVSAAVLPEKLCCGLVFLINRTSVLSLYWFFASFSNKRSIVFFLMKKQSSCWLLKKVL